MNEIIKYFFRVIRKSTRLFFKIFDHYYAIFLLYMNDASFGRKIEVNGTPIINVHKTGKLLLGSYIKINSDLRGNPIGRNGKCILSVGFNAELRIGNNVGLSSTAIIAKNHIEIDDNVIIGANTVIYDTDFHQIKPSERGESEKIKSLPVYIGKNCFIGAHSTILKGVNIGDNAVIGACSVVSRDIPNNEIWAGNPVRFIKRI